MSKVRETEGLEKIHNLMHVFIEGLASGIYTDINDVQADACQYLSMEEAVKKLANWTEHSKIADLAEIFDGISNSMKVREEQEREEMELAEIRKMPTMDEGENNVK